VAQHSPQGRGGALERANIGCQVHRDPNQFGRGFPAIQAKRLR